MAPVVIVTVAEIRALVPSSGIKMNELLARLKGKVESAEQKPRFLALVKANTRYDKANRLLFPLPEIKKEV